MINAARILVSRSRSKVAQENTEVFKVAWESQLEILTDAVDDIVTVDDFLAVSDNHILEDMSRCRLALHERDGVTLEWPTRRSRVSVTKRGCYRSRNVCKQIDMFWK